jgi:hypothetical protein
MHLQHQELRKEDREMTTKEAIQAEIESVPEEDLDRLYDWIKSFKRLIPKDDGRTFMSKLRSIQIDAPEDFAANLDAYMNGEKSVEEGLH